MVRYHDLQFLENDDFFYWSEVEPGDLVHAPGTVAWLAKDFQYRDQPHIKFLTLGHKLLLVISKIDGIPGELGEDVITFVVMSRHGLIVIVKQKKINK